MKLSIKVFEKTFSDEVSKKAYLKACKWIAKHLVEVSNIQYEIKKVKNADLPTFRLTIYRVFDTKNFDNEFCASCKEFHKTFYINQDYDCNWCRVTAYKNQLNRKIIKEQIHSKNGT